jgi:putative chitinase
MEINNLEGVIPDAVFDELGEVMKKFEIDTPLRLAHFLGQCDHESNGFKVKNENLNYSADGLKKIFPKYFPDDLADEYARQPEKIASRVYSNRMGNGDEESGDGWKYRGRGFIQLTGRNNYIDFGEAIEEDIENDPGLVSDTYPLLSAAWFFDKNNINRISDMGDGVDIITKVTKRVNGGLMNLNDRIDKFNKFYTILQ